MFTTVVGTVLATTVALTSCGSGTQTCYTVYINWSVCTEKVRGFDRDWMSSMLNTYSPGHQETLWLSKHGVKNECFSNPTKNHADVAELIPGFGIIFLILSGILLVCTVLCITAHCTRKRTVSPPLVPHIQPVSVWGMGLGAWDTRNWAPCFIEELAIRSTLHIKNRCGVFCFCFCFLFLTANNSCGSARPKLTIPPPPS